MPPYRLIAIDVDGTLLDSSGRIGARTRAAVCAAAAAGCLIVLATGRRLRTAQPVAEALGCSPVLVCSQGATLWRNGRLLYHQHLSVLASRQVIEAHRACGVPVVVFGNAATDATRDIIFVDGDWGANPRLRAYIERNAVWVRPYDEGCLTAGPVQTITLDHVERLRRLCEELERQPQARALYRVIYSVTQLAGGGAVEVLHPSVSKATALEFLCREVGISRHEVLAIGDNVNDVEMLQFAGLGVAVANASDEAKQAAQLVAPSNDEEGVALVLEEYVLNGRCTEGRHPAGTLSSNGSDQ
jgi:hydroxymethylpyrimidine pyrophosphatase-like HAD family hydrolase